MHQDQYFKAGAMWNLHTDICYSPGQDLSNNVFGVPLWQSFSHFMVTSHPRRIVSESTFKAQYIEAFFFVYLFLFYGNSDQNDLQRLQYYIICFISQCKHTKNVSWHCALKTQHREKKIDKSKVIIIIFIIIVAAQFPVQFESPSG